MDEKQTMKNHKTAKQIHEEIDFLNGLPDGSVIKVVEPSSKSTHIYIANTIHNASFDARRWVRNNDRTKVLTSYMVTLRMWRYVSLKEGN